MSSILTIPNLLSFLRMALIPVFISLVYYGHGAWALAVFLVAGISDGIDGFLARKFKQETDLGTVIDPIADKLLMTAAFIVMSLPGIVPPGRHLPIPFWVTAAVVGRDVLIIVVAAAINIITGFRGFRPSLLGKASTLVQVIGISLVLIAANFPSLNGFYLPTVYVVITAFAVISGFHYIFHVAALMREAEAEKQTERS
jgi:cardiolipin synthase